MSDAETTAQPTNRRILQSSRRLAVEILVGFVGVYAAFALTAYKEKRDQIEKRHQLKRALIAEIRPLVAVMRKNTGEGGYIKILDHLDSARKAGGKPIPQPFIEPVGLNMDLWEATKQSGGLNLMDVPTFVKVSEFYNNWSMQMVYYAQVRDVSLNVILPNADRGPSAFYDAKTGQLRTDVRFVYYRNFRALDELTKEGLKLGTEVIQLLARDTI